MNISFWPFSVNEIIFPAHDSVCGSKQLPYKKKTGALSFLRQSCLTTVPTYRILTALLSLFDCDLYITGRESYSDFYHTGINFYIAALPLFLACSIYPLLCCYGESIFLSFPKFCLVSQCPDFVQFHVVVSSLTVSCCFENCSISRIIETIEELESCSHVALVLQSCVVGRSGTAVLSHETMMGLHSD